MLDIAEKIDTSEEQQPQSTESSSLDRLFNNQKKAFSKHPMPTAQERIEHLKSLKQMLIGNQEQIVSAINQDFSCRSRDETLLAELFPSVEGIRYAIKRVKKWMKPSRRHVGILFQPAKARIIYQPMGVVGIIVPWNYPLYLGVGPLTGALAAGNRVMIKMSRNTPQTSQVIKSLIHETFHEDHVTVVEGEDGMGSAFSRKPWDHLIFTGSTSTGRQVMRAAADNLTPVTLELGGKSPAIIGPQVPMKDAAECIAFGKQFNSGQTCVAPDYALCPEDRIEEFVSIFKACVHKMYPSMAKNPQYTSIINQQAHERLSSVIADARDKGAEIIAVNPSGETFETSRKMPIHLLLNVKPEMVVLQKEIFGPLLPVVPYKTLDDAIAYINQRPRPLALYFFDYEKDNIDKVLTNTHSGGACVNDTLMHVAQDDLPFGGVGESGMGQYHSHEGFLTFSKAKGVMIKSKFNSAKLIYPPYGKIMHKLIYRLFLR